MGLSNWVEKNSNCASYDHFDYKVSLKDVIDEIRNCETICKHSFKPLIRFTKKTIKYSKNNKKVKERLIHFASHYDRCIYQYYSFLINEKYNQYAFKTDINANALAYRNNNSLTNIHHAKKAFSFIKSFNNCVVFVGDFTDFFDNLDHKYLKKQLCKVLGEDKLPNNHYAVFKNITKYAYVEKNKIDQILKEQGQRYKKLLMPMKELRKHPDIIEKNKSNFGIPQGISLSAVLSNVYMIDFDNKCMLLAKKFNGLYLRYSDDFIFVFPNKKIIDVDDLYNLIVSRVKSIPKLTLSPEKTQIYYYENRTIRNCETEIGKKENGNNFISYLGFTFDGKNITIRDKTINKFYYRTYKKIKTILKKREKQEKTNHTNLYLNYSLKGVRDEHKNFLTYAMRCKKIFGSKEKVCRVINVHFGKIKKRLKKEKE